jgi:hypothetical protein
MKMFLRHSCGAFQGTQLQCTPNEHQRCVSKWTRRRVRLDGRRGWPSLSTVLKRPFHLSPMQRWHKVGLRGRQRTVDLGGTLSSWLEGNGHLEDHTVDLPFLTQGSQRKTHRTVLFPDCLVRKRTMVTFPCSQPEPLLHVEGGEATWPSAGWGGYCHLCTEVIWASRQGLWVKPGGVSHCSFNIQAVSSPRASVSSGPLGAMHSLRRD